MRQSSDKTLAIIFSLAAGLPLGKARAADTLATAVSNDVLSETAIQATITPIGPSATSPEQRDARTIKDCLTFGEDAAKKGQAVETACKGPHFNDVAIIDSYPDKISFSGFTIPWVAYSVFKQLNTSSPAVTTPAVPQPMPKPKLNGEQLQMLEIAPQSGPFRLDATYISSSLHEQVFHTVSETARKPRWDTIAACIEGARETAKGSDVRHHDLAFTCSNSFGSPAIDGRINPAGTSVTLHVVNPANAGPRFWKTDAERDLAIGQSRATAAKLGIKPLAPGQP